MGWTKWEKYTGQGLDFSDILFEKKHHTELEGGVARITINRPDKYNTFNSHTVDELFRAFYAASHDPLIGVVVFTGAGEHFGAGGDMEWEAWGMKEQVYWRYSPFRLARLCRKPVIAVVQGYCIGGHHVLAYCCDFTIASETAIFGQNGPRVASPADGYIMPYLARVVGAKKAREIWMLCRRYTASEAMDMGLVNKVVPLEHLEDEVDQWCEELLMASPGCIEIVKASFDWELDTMPQAGVIGSWLDHDWFEKPEFREGIQAFEEKRRPNFWKIRKQEMNADDR